MRPHRPLRSLLVAATGVLLSSALLWAARPAAAEPYPAVPPQITTSTGAVSGGGAVHFTGTGFIPGEEIEITVAYGEAQSRVLKTVNADANGDFSTDVTLTEPGTATVAAFGKLSLVRAVATVTVLTPVAAVLPAGDLPTTGDSWHRLAWEVGGGAAALGAGSALLWLTARRRRTAA
ncbi:hypothetical protein [Dactylosporangium sp. CA-092794]|uniref:hypothetical protein n=1 Tax=Dactylosporangium sp. CA-092794 TaxID=3239929 RepID=UPI003D8D1F98